MLEHFRQTEPKGEIVITLAGKKAPEKAAHQNKYRKTEAGDYEGAEEN